MEIGTEDEIFIDININVMALKLMTSSLNGKVNRLMRW